MHIIGEAADAGWLKASLNGNVGLVPRTHVEIAAANADASASKAAARPGMGLTASPSGSGAIRTAKAKYTYVRQNPDELSFEVSILTARFNVHHVQVPSAQMLRYSKRSAPCLEHLIKACFQ